MAKLTRITGKVFGATASATGNDPEIGQFGSALAGTYNGTTDVATIQGLTAWSNGFIGAVTPTNQYPPLPEMTGFGKVITHQTSYLLQEGVPEYDANTTYYENSICKGINNEGNLVLYRSITDNNTGNALTDTLNWEELAFGGGARNVGEIVQSTIPQTDAGLHLLDGSLLQYGSYASFIDHIASIYDSGDYPSLFTTEADWQASVTTYGACPRFVYDSVSNTVRIPKRNTEHGNLIKSYKSGSNWYRVYEDGWCEQGGFVATTVNAVQSYTANLHIAYTDTSFFFTRSTNWTTTINTSLNSSLDNGFQSKTTQSVTFRQHESSLDAGVYWYASGYVDVSGYQYSPIYEYLVIATSTKTSIEVDIDEIATDLNGKADVDLTNVTGTSKGASWALPSSVFENVTAGASGAEYTAPANGWYTVNGTNGQVLLTNIANGMQSAVNGTSTWARAIMPVLKGQKVQLYYQSTTLSYFRFVYAEGSKGEA